MPTEIKTVYMQKQISVAVQRLQCQCNSCGYRWLSRKPVHDPPLRCPHCTSVLRDIPRDGQMTDMLAKSPVAVEIQEGEGQGSTRNGPAEGNTEEAQG